MSRGEVLACAAAMSVVSACTFEPGGSFATLAASLDLHARPSSGRAVDGDWQRLASDYQVHFDVALATVTDLRLVDASIPPGLFDPANPPAGYGNCHNGHCHALDGRVVSYDDIAVELSGGKATVRTLVSLPVGAVDLLSDGRRALACQPSCELPRGHVRKLEATLVSLQLEGSVRDGLAAPRLVAPRRFRVLFGAADVGGTTATSSAKWAGAVDLPLDRSHSPDVRLDVAARVGAGLLDTVDWQALAAAAGDGAEVVLDPLAAGAGAARVGVLEALASVALDATLDR